MASNSSGHKPNTSSAWPSTGEGHSRRLDAFEANPHVAAILRKLVPDVGGNGEVTHQTSRGEVNVPDPAYLRQISTSLAQDTTDATSLMQLLPDLGLVENLLVSAIMAPKDLVSSKLTFTVDRRMFDLQIAGRMLEVVIDHFTNIYKIKELCPRILRQALFYAGSYVIMVIPENSVDELINGKVNYSNESFKERRGDIYTTAGHLKSMRFLGEGAPLESAQKINGSLNSKVIGIGMESFTVGAQNRGLIDQHPAGLKDYRETVTITDNYNVAKFGPLLEAKRQAEVRNALYPARSGAGLESADYALGGVQRRRTFGASAMVQAVRTKDMIAAPTVGHPLVMHLPSESVIPVFIRPEKHLGYFVLLDSEGNPIALANRKDIYNDLTATTAGVGSSSQSTSQMIQMAQNLSIGSGDQGGKDPIQMARVYGQILENDLRQRLSNGMYGESATFKATDEIYQVMMARSLKRMQTQILYVPADLITYYAFDYSENGTGRSLTEKSKILGSIRSMLMFANVMAGIKNSVSRQKVTLQLSDNDIDPSKTLARTMDEFTRRRNVTMPFVTSEPNDMISYLNVAGIEWNVEGKGAPAHKVDVEDKISNRAKVDSDLNNELRDRHYMAYGMTPETVMASTQAEFATTALINNQMMAKRVISIQDEFTPQLEDNVQKISRNSAIIMNKLREIILTSLKEETVQKEGDAETDIADVVDGKQIATMPVDPLSTPATLESRTTREAVSEDDKIMAVERIAHDFIDAIRIALPRPDTATVENQSHAFDTYAEAVDKKLSMMIDPAFLTDANLGEYASHIEEVKAALKAVVMRQWMASNGYLPELDQLTAIDEDGNPELDLGKETTDYAANVAKGLRTYLEQVGKLKETIHADATALDTEFPNAALNNGGGDTGGDLGGGDTGGFGGDDTAGDGDLGGGGSDDLGGGLGDGLDDTGEELGDTSNNGKGSTKQPPVAEDADPATADIDTDADALTTGESESGKTEEEERAEREKEEEEEANKKP